MMRRLLYGLLVVALAVAPAWGGGKGGSAGGGSGGSGGGSGGSGGGSGGGGGTGGGGTGSGGSGSGGGASAPSVSVGSGGGSIYTPLGLQELVPDSRLIPPKSAPWWGMTPLQERAWDAWKACERPFMTLGSLDYTGRITYSGLEMELPNF